MFWNTVLQGNKMRKELLEACDACGSEAGLLAFGLSEDATIEQIEQSWRSNLFQAEGQDVLKRLDAIMNKKTNDCQDSIKT